MANTQVRLSLQITNSAPPSPHIRPRDLFRPKQTTKKQVRFILPVEIPPSRAISLHILRAQCFLALEEPLNALQQANHAIKIALHYNVVKLQPKAQLCRAKCLIEVGRWEEAKSALVRAASIRDNKGEVEELGVGCEYQLQLERYIVDIEKD